MALTFAQKETIVAEVAEVAKNAYSAIGAEYRGLTVEQMTDLRVRARQAGVYVRVVKNTLAKRALADTEFACLADELKGPLLLAFGREDPGSAARVAESFAKEHDNVERGSKQIGSHRRRRPGRERGCLNEDAGTLFRRAMRLRVIEDAARYPR